MEHFIRIAFWIISVSLSCSHPIKKRSTLSDFGESYLRNVTCDSTSTFYAPTNVKPECYTKALDCILVEFEGTVNKECSAPDGRINQSMEFLDQWRDEQSNIRHALTNSTECECENWPQVPFINFLNEVMSLLECLNTEAAG